MDSGLSVSSKGWSSKMASMASRSSTSMLKDSCVLLREDHLLSRERRPRGPSGGCAVDEQQCCRQGAGVDDEVLAVLVADDDRAGGSSGRRLDLLAGVPSVILPSVGQVIDRPETCLFCQRYARW